MAVIKIADNKPNLPPIVKVTIGSSSKLYTVKTKSTIFNSVQNNQSTDCK